MPLLKPPRLFHFRHFSYLLLLAIARLLERSEYCDHVSVTRVELNLHE